MRHLISALCLAIIAGLAATTIVRVDNPIIIVAQCLVLSIASALGIRELYVR
jgi:hypothetical protein